MREHDQATEHGRQRNGAARSAPAPRDLEAQIAALAAQIRRLGERLNPSAAGDEPHSGTGSAAAPSTAAGAAVRVQPLADVGEEPRPTTAPSDTTGEEPFPGALSFSASILATASTVATEIRAAAEREAQRIRANAIRKMDGQTALLQRMLSEHRATLDALRAEADRVEQSATVLRAQTRALEAGLRMIEDSLSSIITPPG